MLLDQVHQQRLGRAVEDAVDELADHVADHLAFGLRGPVDVGAVGLVLLEILLLFQDLHHGHDRGVGDLAAFQQRLVDVATVALSRSQTIFMISSSCSVRVVLRRRILIN